MANVRETGTAKRFIEKLNTCRSAAELKKYERYFPIEKRKGDKDRKQLLRFLDKHAAVMPRVALRNTIEKLDRK